MSRVPIRVRVAAAFAVAMAIVLAATGLFVYARLGDDLARALDQDLRLRGQDLSALVREPDRTLAAESHGLYVPKEQPVYPSSLRLTAAIAGSTHIGGSIDEVSVAGSRVTASGWTEIPATVPGRTFSVFPSEGIALAMKVVTTDRSDAARALRDSRLVFSGFRLELDYPSEEMARKIAESLCVVVEAPGHSASVLSRTKVSCPPLPARGTS